MPLYRHFADLAGKSKVTLPVPSLNIINGGKHAGNKLAMQEFMILPVDAPSFSEAMRMSCEVYAILKSVIKKKYGQVSQPRAAAQRTHRRGRPGCCSTQALLATGPDSELSRLHPFNHTQDATNVGDEGGFAPAIQANNEGLDLVVEVRACAIVLREMNCCDCVGYGTFSTLESDVSVLGEQLCMWCMWLLIPLIMTGA